MKNAFPNRLHRLGQILKVFLEEKTISTNALAEQFQTSVRTIQRDLKLLKQSGFPLKETGKGIYQLDKSLLKDYAFFDETELALICALKSLISQLGTPFEKAVNTVFSKLYYHSPSVPVFIKMDKPIDLEGTLFKKIVKAIQNKRQVSFEYEVFSPYQVKLEPYKIACFDGFWYLIGKDSEDKEIKRYALDKIKKFKVLRKHFVRVPSVLDEILRNSANIWFSAERNIKVVVLVDKECATYFKRRQMFPTQKIEEEKPDGSLVISFWVGNFGEIINILKSWLPSIKVLAPEELKEELLKQVKRWMEWQGETLGTGIE